MKTTTASVTIVFALAILAGWAVVFPGPIFANCVWYLVLLFLMATVLWAIISTGPMRSFVRGFAVFGVAFFVMGAMCDNFAAADSADFRVRTDLARPALMTTWLLAWAYDALAMPELWTRGGTRVPALHLLSVSPSQIPVDLITTTFVDFMRIGECLFAVAMGLVGGWAGWWLAGRENLEATSPHSL